MSTQEDEIKRLVKYLKQLDILYKKEPNTVRSILTMVNRYVFAPMDAKKVSRHQDLAERMLDFGVYQKVVEFAVELIQDAPTRNGFMEAMREDTGEPREALIRDYLQPIPKGSVAPPHSTLDDLIRFFKGAPSDVRYFIIVEDNNSVLVGIVSVNDFTRNIEKIRTIEKNTLVTNLEFFNRTPKVAQDTDTMEFAASLFDAAEQAGKKITKLLVVDEKRRPTGFLAEPDIVRWEAVNI